MTSSSGSLTFNTGTPEQFISRNWVLKETGTLDSLRPGLGLLGQTFNVTVQTGSAQKAAIRTFSELKEGFKH